MYIMYISVAVASMSLWYILVDVKGLCPSIIFDACNSVALNHTPPTHSNMLLNHPTARSMRPILYSLAYLGAWMKKTKEMRGPSS